MTPELDEIDLDTVPLGRTGLRTSELQLGTWRFGRVTEAGNVEIDEAHARELLDGYEAAGGRYIDTADVYGGGDCERWIGDWLDERDRERYTIASKVYWQIDFGRGEVPDPPDYDFNDLPYAATGNGTDDSVDNPSVNRDDYRSGKFDYVNVVEPPGLEIDLDEGTATIEFDENTADKMHLASFETPGAFQLRNDEISRQDRFDVAYTTATSGSLTVDIPVPEAYADG